ncbi:hypothetical protein AB0G86_05730 [Streptomyces scabiei]|uniref:hypothetical protein n=1 Tax=Streptomyces scabiei TaxID=1930 RepID=UPI0033E5BC46
MSAGRTSSTADIDWSCAATLCLLDTRWVAIWPSAGEPAPAIGLFMRGGFLERGYESEAAQLDLRIWRPATPRPI